LARRRFAAKTPVYEGWISLDFLGFSRPNLDLSIGYVDFSRKKISRALFRRRNAGKGACGLGMPEAQECSWAELKLTSDFLQEIVVRADFLMYLPGFSP
jgi:hypothetical protein